MNEDEKQSKAKHSLSGSRLGRRIQGAVLGVLTIVMLWVGLSLLELEEEDGSVDRFYAQTLGSVVAMSSQAISTVFGEDGLANPSEPWRGVRVYRPELDAWVTISELGDEQIGTNAVVLVHGLDEPGGIWDQLAPALALAGHTVLRFDYANDQAITLSADDFTGVLARLKARGVERVDLVSHSMGGLVSLDAISRDGFGDLGIGVDHFITIGTPFGGSPWARLRAVAEIREQVQRWVESDDLDPARLMGFARDGVGQAGRDLLPGSDYLSSLEARSLPEGVVVTNIVGRTVGGSEVDEDGGLRLGSLFVDGALGDLIGQRDAGVVQDEIEKLSQELGDGVVPMSSAVLDGVDDVVILKANHRGLVRNIELGVAIRQMGSLAPMDEPPAIQVVLDRLRD